MNHGGTSGYENYDAMEELKKFHESGSWRYERL
jgi:hypothetical protein